MTARPVRRQRPSAPSNPAASVAAGPASGSGGGPLTSDPSAAAGGLLSPTDTLFDDATSRMTVGVVAVGAPLVKAVVEVRRAGLPESICYYTQPTASTPVDDVVNARLAQNAPRLPPQAVLPRPVAGGQPNHSHTSSSPASNGHGGSQSQSRKGGHGQGTGAFAAEEVQLLYHCAAWGGGFRAQDTSGLGAAAAITVGVNPFLSSGSSQSHTTTTSSAAGDNNGLSQPRAEHLQQTSSSPGRYGTGGDPLGLLGPASPLAPPVMRPEDIEAENATWARVQQGRVRTTHAVLFMNLRIGGDPPDVERIEPCARLECWLDPKTMQAKYMGRASEKITETLEAQYRALQRDCTYKRVVEGSIEDAKHALTGVRKRSRKDGGRVLVHYNGHGMPKATSFGEVWFTGKDHYHPVSIFDLAQAVETPTIYVFDCNQAGYLLHTWRTSSLPLTQSQDILLCACGENEILPMNPLLPADLLTSCLTTPLTVALEWYIHYSNRRLLLPNVTPEMIRHMPGDVSNRRTPLGELQTILGTVLDCIAWCTLPREVYYPVLRNDVLVRVLFRNFILADRLLREVGCTPMSHPALPEAAHSHHLWDSWDAALEAAVSQLPDLLCADLTPNPAVEYRATTFFADQLTAFSVWVDVDDKHRQPEQLPVVLLCLSQTTYRVRALLLLCRYLDTGAVAVHSALYCGLAPLISRLLTNAETLLVLIILWLQIMNVDPGFACVELARAHAETIFLRFMQTQGNAFRLVTGEEATAPHTAADPSTSGAQSLTPVAGGPTSDSPQTQQQQFSSSAYVPATSEYLPAQQQQQQSLQQQSSGTNPTSPTTATGGQEDGGLPAYCALEGITMNRCRAVCCYLLCRQLEHSAASLGGSTGGGSSSVPSTASSLSNMPPQAQAPPPPPAQSQGTANSAISIWNAMGMNTTIQLISTSDSVEVRSWACLLLSRLVGSLRVAKEFLLTEFSRRRGLFYPLLDHASPVLRASCVTLLGSLLGSRIDALRDTPEQDRRVEMDKSLLQMIALHTNDPARAVRTEIAVAVSQIIYAYYPLVRAAHAAGILNTPRFVGLATSTTTVPPPNASSNTLDALVSPAPTRKSTALSPSKGQATSSDTTTAAGSSTGGSIPRDGLSPGAGSLGTGAGQHVTLAEMQAMRSRAFLLEETDLGVASALSKGLTSGTGPAADDRAAQFHTTVITRDDPPIVAPWNLRNVSKHNVTVLETLLHDAMVILARAMYGCDPSVAAAAWVCFNALAAGTRPHSDRIATEAVTTMRGVASDASPSVTEADRVRERRNADLMRQVALDLPVARTFQPVVAPSMSSISASDAPATPISGSSKETLKSPVTASPIASQPSMSLYGFADFSEHSRPHHRIQHALPSTHHDAVISAQFRALEPHLVTIERSNRISVLSYEDRTAPAQLLESFRHVRKEPITAALIIDDLAEYPGLLVVDRAGVFSVYTRLLSGRPVLASSFLAANGPSSVRAPPSQLSDLAAHQDIHCAYRPLDALLFYGSANGGLHALSIAEEQAVLHLATPGEGYLSAVHCQGGGGRAVLAGFTDGLVRHYDDRQRGATSIVQTLESRPLGQRTTLDGVLGTSMAGDTTVFVCTRTTLSIFDIRNAQQPVRSADVLPPVPAARGLTSVLGSQASAPRHLAASFGACTHYPLVSVMTTEGICDVYNHRAESLLVSGASVAPNHTFYSGGVGAASAAAAPAQGSPHAPSSSHTSSTHSTQAAPHHGPGSVSSAVTVYSGHAAYRPLRLRSENTIANTTFHPMKPMALFGNEIVSLL